MTATIITSQQISEAEEQLLEAMKISNVEALDDLLHDDLLFILPTGEVITKEMDLATHRSGNLVFYEISPSISSIKLIEDTAVVALISKMKGKMLEQSFEGQFRYIRVWKMCGGQLKVIAGSCLPI